MIRSASSSEKSRRRCCRVWMNLATNTTDAWPDRQREPLGYENSTIRTFGMGCSWEPLARLNEPSAPVSTSLLSRSSCYCVDKNSSDRIINKDTVYSADLPLPRRCCSIRTCMTVYKAPYPIQRNQKKELSIRRSHHHHPLYCLVLILRLVKYKFQRYM